MKHLSRCSLVARTSHKKMTHFATFATSNFQKSVVRLALDSNQLFCGYFYFSTYFLPRGQYVYHKMITFIIIIFLKCKNNKTSLEPGGKLWMGSVLFANWLRYVSQPVGPTTRISFHFTRSLKKGYKEMRKASPEIKLLFDVADLDKSSVSQIDALNLTSQESEESF